MQYNDPTQSVRRFPYQKQADGSWKKLTDPKDKGGDDNLYYEDKLALIWNINNSIKGFTSRVAWWPAMPASPASRSVTNTRQAKGELGDIWHMKIDPHRPFGQIDDQYLDDTRYDARQGAGSRTQERSEDRRRLHRHQTGQRQARVHEQGRHCREQRAARIT